MNLRHLRHFLAVGEIGSITAAAKSLHLTQPALSRQIKGLEEELETLLLARGAHSFTLTPAGEVLMQEARKLIRASEAMAAKVKSSAGAHLLRVGYAPSLANDFLSVAIERFTQLHPQARIILADCSSAEMITMLADGKLDLIVTVTSPKSKHTVVWTGLRSYQWRVAIPASHPLAKKRLLTPKDLAGERLLLFEKEHYPEYWERVTSYFKAHHLQAKVAGEFDGVSSLTSALEGNLGIALLSESSRVTQSTHKKIVSRPLSEQPTPIQVSAGIHPDYPPTLPLLAFIEELKTAAQESYSTLTRAPPRLITLPQSHPHRNS